jgi:membrane protein required for colicin V production
MMSTIDIVILVIVGLSLLIGIVRGFIKEALSLASWFAAIVVASMFSLPFSEYLVGVIENPSIRRVAASVILFVGTVFVGSMINNLIARFTERSGIRGADRALGGLFGVFRGGVIVALLVLLSIPFEFTEAWFEESRLVPFALEAVGYLEQLWQQAEAVIPR